MRTALRLREGDEIAYTIRDGAVVLSRVQPGASAEDPFATFTEWETAADQAAYAGL